MPRLTEAEDGGEVRREEARYRYCLVWFPNLLSGPCKDVRRCVVAHVRTFAGDRTR